MQILRYGDIQDSCNINAILELIRKSHPDLECLEIYHLCAQSHVHVSFQLPEYTGVTDALGTLKLLECMRSSGISSSVHALAAVLRPVRCHTVYSTCALIGSA